MQLLFKEIIPYFSLGVTLFFVISGYCIAAICDAARHRSLSIKTYFYKRFRRIFPPFWVSTALAISAVAILTLCGFPPEFFEKYQLAALPSELSPLHWLGNLTLTETWSYKFHASSPRLYAAHIWTLCYEEQFYLVCGALLLFFPKRFFAAAFALSLLVGLIVVFKFDSMVDGLFLNGLWLSFAAGILIYYRLHHAAPIAGAD